MNNKYIATILCCLIVACASEESKFINRTPEEVEQKALNMLKNGEYNDAAEEFKIIDTLFPYSEKANNSQIMSIYCLFMGGEYNAAIRNVDVFMRYHPTHKLVPYILYIKAMSLYCQVAAVGRTSAVAIDAKNTFVNLANRFPNSIYYKDCIAKIFVLDDITAAHEMLIGKYYQKKKNAAAAINRYNFIIAKFPHTSYAPEAYFRIYEVCNSIGMKNEAQKNAAILQKSYPKNNWAVKLSSTVKQNNETF